MRYLLVLLGLLVSGTAQAIDCREVPDCKAMGYSTESDPNCKDDGYIFCPFDQAYKKCVNMNCEALGFTQSDKSSWCASLISCKSDSTMTLCQKPCFAMTYQELKELAESGECKIVTMRNDIKIPQNEGITLHADTIIDGGNHTLYSSGNKGFDVYKLNDTSGFKNIKLGHTQTQMQSGFRFLAALNDTYHMSLENIDISVSSDDKGDAQRDPWAPVVEKGIYNVRGKFTLDVQSVSHLISFGYNTIMNFMDAQVSINNVNGGGGDLATGAKVNLMNSTMDANISSVYFPHKGSATLKNSKANFKGLGLFYGENKEENEIVLEESTITLDTNITSSSKTYINAGAMATITLKGSSEHPSVLDMTFSSGDLNHGQTNIIATSTTDKLTLNGVTYHPTRVGTTLLSDVGSSGNWEKVSQ